MESNYFMTPTSECITAAILCCAHDVIEGRENDWSLRSFSPCFKPGYTVKVGQVCQDLREAVQCSGENRKVQSGDLDFIPAFWQAGFVIFAQSLTLSLFLSR